MPYMPSIMTECKTLHIVTQCANILRNTHNGGVCDETHLLTDILAAFEVMVSIRKDLRLHNRNNPVLEPRTQFITHTMLGRYYASNTTQASEHMNMNLP